MVVPPDSQARRPTTTNHGAYRRNVVRAVVALVYSVTLIVPWLLDVGGTLTIINWGCAAALWVALATEYIVRLVRSRDRRSFIRHAVATPLLLASPLLMMLNVPAALVVTVLIVAFVIELRHFAFGHQFVMALTAVIGIGLIAAIAMAIFERNAPSSQLRTVGDTLTWALSTVLDVRGDNAQPVTSNGRILGIVLVLCGVLFTWAMFSQITSWILGGQKRSLDRDAVDGIVRQAIADAQAGRLAPPGGARPFDPLPRVSDDPLPPSATQP